MLLSLGPPNFSFSFSGGHPSGGCDSQAVFPGGGPVGLGHQFSANRPGGAALAEIGVFLEITGFSCLQNTMSFKMVCPVAADLVRKYNLYMSLCTSCLSGDPMLPPYLMQKGSNIAYPHRLEKEHGIAISTFNGTQSTSFGQQF